MGKRKNWGKEFCNKKIFDHCLFFESLLIWAVDMFGYECVQFYNTKNSVVIVEALRLSSILDNHKMF